jgi:hypothetical protein
VLAKSLFPRRLQGITDPMSGFFAVRLGAVPLPTLRPTGYKILLEIVARSRLSRVRSVPYVFQPRAAGESKASLREGLRFLRHPRWASGGRLAGEPATAVQLRGGCPQRSITRWVGRIVPT